jgi:hypothetical protein
MLPGHLHNQLIEKKEPLLLNCLKPARRNMREMLAVSHIFQMSVKQGLVSTGFYNGEPCVWILREAEGFKLEFQKQLLTLVRGDQEFPATLILQDQGKVYRSVKASKDEAEHLVKTSLLGRTDQKINWRDEPEDA